MSKAFYVVASLLLVNMTVEVMKKTGDWHSSAAYIIIMLLFAIATKVLFEKK